MGPNSFRDALEDDDDIEWPEDSFDVIQFKGTPALQDALRAFCRDVAQQVTELMMTV